MATTTQVIPFDIEAQKRAAARVTEGVNRASLELTAKTLVVRTDEDYRACMEFRNQCATYEKRIMDFWAPLADGANKLHKMLTGARGEAARPWAALKDSFGKKAEVYLLEQKRAKREADEALARAAEEERLRLAREADDLMSRGYVKEAMQKEQTAAMTMAPTLPDYRPVADNARVGDKWNWKLTDMVAVCKAVAEGRVPLMWEVRGEQRPLVVIDTVVMNAIVSRMGGATDIPGLTLEEGVRISAAKL